MGQVFAKTRDVMNNWWWANPHAFGDEVDHSNPLTSSSGNVKRNGEHFSGFSSDDLRAKIEPPDIRQYTPGGFLAIRPLNCDEIIDEDDDDETWADPGAPSSGRSRPVNGNDKDDSKGEDDTQRCEKETGKGKGTNDGKGKRKVTEDGKGKGKGKGKGNGKGKGIVKATPGGDDISRAVALQLQKDMSEADLDTQGILELV